MRAIINAVPIRAALVATSARGALSSRQQQAAGSRARSLCDRHRLTETGVGEHKRAARHEVGQVCLLSGRDEDPAAAGGEQDDRSQAHTLSEPSMNSSGNHEHESRLKEIANDQCRLSPPAIDERACDESDEQIWQKLRSAHETDLGLGRIEHLDDEHVDGDCRH